MIRANSRRLNGQSKSTCRSVFKKDNKLKQLCGIDTNKEKLFEDN